jgi:hypothetical protein
MSTKKFWARVVDSKDALSAKRLVTLIVSAHFIVTSFVILYLISYMIFYVPKGRTDPMLLNLLNGIIEKDSYIILAGLGFITSDNLFTLMLEKAKAKANADILSPTPVKAEKIENVNVVKETPKPDNPDA